MNNLLNTKEVAKILGVSRRTLIRWEKQGRLISQRTAGAHRRYTWEQIKQFKKISKEGRKKYLSLRRSGEAGDEAISKIATVATLPRDDDKRSFREINEYLVSFSKCHSLFFVIPRLTRDPRLLVNWIPAFAGMTRKVAGMTKELFGILSKRQKIVYASFISLFLILSLGVVGARILGLSTSEDRLFKESQSQKNLAGVSTSFPLDTPDTLHDGSVLAESTVKPNFVLNVGIPSLFKQNAEFLKELKVQGKMVLTEGIEAPNVINSLTAGSGISITSGQAPTITNTGVLSLGGSTGTLSLTAGSGITIDGLKITNSSLGSDQKIFKTIKVGSTTFDAGSNTDTLTIAAGTGITISSDTSNKKLTITGVASDLNASGFTDDGTIVRLTTSTDNVGIGTTSPSSKLEVAGTVQLRGSSSATGLYVDSSGNIGIGTTSPVSLLDVNRLFNVLSGGNVGVGTTSPLAKLDVNGAASMAGNLTFTGSRTIAGDSMNPLTIGNTSTSHLILNPAGNVGVGTTLPSGLFDVNGKLTVQSGGNVGIGTTSPIAALDVRGNLGTVPAASVSANSSFAALVVDNRGNGDLLTASNSGVTKFVVTKTGDLTVYGSATTCTIGSGTAATNCSSDIRLKDNVSSLDGLTTLEKVMLLNPVNFTWKNNPNLGTKTGLIAQEVKQVFPEFVNPLPDGYLGLDYAGLVSPLVKAVQEQQSEISNLKSQISNLNWGEGLAGLPPSEVSSSTTKKSAFADSGDSTQVESSLASHLIGSIADDQVFVKSLKGL